MHREALEVHSLLKAGIIRPFSLHEADEVLDPLWEALMDVAEVIADQEVDATSKQEKPESIEDGLMDLSQVDQ